MSLTKEDAPKQRMVGPYILGRTLGEGGTAKVKLGTHIETQQRVALKILKKTKFNMTSSVRKQVEREIEAMARVQHKNVIRLIEVDWDCKYPKKKGPIIDVILVILELATGGELFEFLHFSGSFEESVARAYFHQLIEGVAECHTHNVAHRDLKPENLLLDENFTLKIADFGFSKIINESGARLMYTECGTPGYMAPEMLNMNGYDPTLCDVWACGVILFIMLAGFPPFQRPALDDWWFDKLSKNKHSLFWQAHCRSAYFSEETKDFINKILTPDPAKRMTIEQMREHAWFKGPSMSQVALAAELGRRKDEVDGQKRKDSHELKGDTLTGNLVDKNQMRSNGDELELAAVPEPYVSQENVSCYTRFESSQPPLQILHRLSAAMVNLGIKHELKQSEFRIKAKCVTEAGVIGMQAQVFADPSDQTRYICEVRRRQGDSMQFRHLYDKMLKELQGTK